MPRLLLAGILLPLAACTQTIEQQMARAAERINASKPHNVESARAEGRKLIVHLAGSPSATLTNDEMARIAAAGLCSMEEVRATVKQGGSIRIEVGSDFGSAAADVDRCPAA
jgi:hypothetical protein